MFALGESAIRVGLTRLASEGKVLRCGRGCYALNRQGQALSRAVDGWQHKEAQTVPWGGGWLAVHD
ncbi:hypothetical protein, partial [Stenotrophomonas sp. YIM B06876]|uniref:hypothetical protein n=1 Tax=Stenotrophomonas sp. YIM B06876 TaxID=3060211 RepID=UPI0027387C07